MRGVKTMANIKGLDNVTVSIHDKEGNEIASGIKVGSMKPEPIEVNSTPWYKTQKHYEIKPVFTRNGIRGAIHVLPAGTVWLLARKLDKMKTALKYAKHSKRKAKLSKRIAIASDVYRTCNLHEVGVHEAVKIIRGVK
jgi:hypothetical protein